MVLQQIVSGMLKKLNNFRFFRILIIEENYWEYCAIARVENMQFLRDQKRLALGMFIDVF
jgi:hypothetical protein